MLMMMSDVVLNLSPGGTTVGVATHLGGEPHLDDEQGEHGGHHDGAGHGGVDVGEEIGETWVRQAVERRWYELWEV